MMSSWMVGGISTPCSQQAPEEEAAMAGAAGAFPLPTPYPPRSSCTSPRLSLDIEDLGHPDAPDRPLSRALGCDQVLPARCLRREVVAELNSGVGKEEMLDAVSKTGLKSSLLHVSPRIQSRNGSGE